MMMYSIKYIKHGPKNALVKSKKCIKSNLIDMINCFIGYRSRSHTKTSP